MYVAAVPLCPLYAGPDEHSQRVDEILMGWPVTGPEKIRGDWWLVRTHYGYPGWVNRVQLSPVGERSAALRRLVVTAPFADVLAQPDVERPVVTTLLRGAWVLPLDENCPQGWRQVALPDRRCGYTKSSFVEEYHETAGNTEEAIRQAVVARAKSYLGVQYRWGGKSPMGIDCSGLAFMAWFFSGVFLYRDARIVPGYPVRPVPHQTCRPADLLYFPGHVAICLGEGRYIHATAKAGSDGVVINSLDPAHPEFRPDLAERLLTGGTVFPLGARTAPL